MGRNCRLQRCFVGAVLASVLLAQRAVAEENLGQPQPGKEAAIIQAGKQYLAALERGDPKEAAEFWTADGTYTDASGRVFKARDLIASQNGGTTTTRPSARVFDVSIRFITPEVAIEEGGCEPIASKGGEGAASGRFSAIWVFREGKWKLEDLREWRSQPQGDSSHLKSLDPLIGQWSGSDGNRTIRLTAQWNLDKTYLHRDLSVTDDGKEVFASRQEIGWDPATQQIRSWLFASDGSRAEATWSLEGTAWLVHSRVVHPDGSSSDATHVLKFPGRDKLVYRSVASDTGSPASERSEIVLARTKNGE